MPRRFQEWHNQSLCLARVGSDPCKASWFQLKVSKTSLDFIQWQSIMFSCVFKRQLYIENTSCPHHVAISDLNSRSYLHGICAFGREYISILSRAYCLVQSYKTWNTSLMHQFTNKKFQYLEHGNNQKPTPKHTKTMMIYSSSSLLNRSITVLNDYHSTSN